MKRILIVDDSRMLRLYVRQILSSLPEVELLDAENGVAALELALTHPPDLFLVDVNMPKMDGYTLLSRIRTQPSLCATPAIVATTEARPQDRERAYAAGANAHVQKPFYPEHFLSLVSLLLGTTS